jgi:hypothetical protein
VPAVDRADIRQRRAGRWLGADRASPLVDPRALGSSVRCGGSLISAKAQREPPGISQGAGRAAQPMLRFKVMGVTFVSTES